MIGWIKYLWGCDWSKENDIFDSCQVLSQHESEIRSNLDQRLSFLSARRFTNFQIKNKMILKESLWDQGNSIVVCFFFYIKQILNIKFPRSNYQPIVPRQKHSNV